MLLSLLRRIEGSSVLLKTYFLCFKEPTVLIFFFYFSFFSSVEHVEDSRYLNNVTLKKFLETTTLQNTCHSRIDTQ